MVRQELHQRPLPPPAPQEEKSPSIPNSTESPEILEARARIHGLAVAVPGAYGARSVEEVYSQGGRQLNADPEGKRWLEVSRGFHIFKEKGITSEQAQKHPDKPFYTLTDIMEAYDLDSPVVVQYEEETNWMRDNGPVRKAAPDQGRPRITSRGRGGG